MIRPPTLRMIIPLPDAPTMVSPSAGDSIRPFALSPEAQTEIPLQADESSKVQDQPHMICSSSRKWTHDRKLVLSEMTFKADLVSPFHFL